MTEEGGVKDFFISSSFGKAPESRLVVVQCRDFITVQWGYSIMSIQGLLEKYPTLFLRNLVDYNEAS